MKWVARRARGWRSLCALAVTVSACWGARDARDVIERTDLTRSPYAELPWGYTYVTSVRELPDGSIIVTDPRESRVDLLRFDPAARSPIARDGSGPREWSRAYPLVATNDSESIQFDPAARRLHAYVGAELVSVTTSDALPFASVLHGADSAGGVYTIAGSTPRDVGTTELSQTDSIVFVRLSLRDGSADTVALLRDAPGRVHSRREEDGSLRYVGASRPAFAVREQAVGFTDGWVAVARLDPYRIEWQPPSGTRLVGPVVAADPVPVNDSIKELYLRQNRRLISSLQSGPPEMRAALMSRFSEFPEHLPPFSESALIAGADGMAYVERFRVEFDGIAVYDAFDRTGARVAQFSFGRRERMIAVGREVIYTVSTDDDGLQRVRRYGKPAWRAKE